MQPAFDWVVRGGVADWQALQKAYVIDENVTPPVYGFSVQYAPGIAWEELTRTGNIQNGKVCYANRKDLEVAMKQLGYTLLLVATPGRGYHHELSLVLVKDGLILTTLPDQAAQALGQVFRQHVAKNPLRP